MSSSVEFPLRKDDGRFRGRRVAIVSAGSPTAGAGGAERFYAGLKAGFELIGCQADFVEVQADEPSVDKIVLNYELAAAKDLSHFDIVVSSKVPTYAIRHPRHVVFLNHAVRIFDDMFETHFPNASADDYCDRARIHRADLDALLAVPARICQGFEVSRRLRRWRGLGSRVVHPPLGFNGFRPGDGEGEHFLIAGRLHPWKRFDLLIEAVRHSSKPMRLLIAGEGEHGPALRALAGDDPRIQFLGRISDGQLVDLYSRAIAIPFLPQREDYGYVTLEAFASACPVLTCTDSGEPAHIVRNHETGLVVEPTPEAVSVGLEWFWSHRDDARRMGQRGLALVEAMSWRDTAFELACAATGEASVVDEVPLNVAVLDMQPIAPAVGGGRLRLLGLYHNLGNNVSSNYVGTYDWPGESYRAHYLSPTLHEIDVPLTTAHFVAADDMARRAGGKNVIDLAFSRQAHLSPEYVAAARKAVDEARVVVFSHPWIYPLVKDRLRPNQIVIYESHNVEGYLRAQLLDDRNPVEREVLEGVIADELECGKRADWILACSHEDLLRFNRLYGFSPAKMRVVPNGVMAFAKGMPADADRKAARLKVGLNTGAFAAIFIGSGYGPNRQAAAFINERLASLCPEVIFIVAGGVGEGMVPTSGNVIITGQIDDETRDLWYAASDCAVNPMLAGSGTNIKMFDFFSSGLPVISTDIGARGIDTSGQPFLQIVPAVPEAFATALLQLRKDPALRAEMGRAARLCVEDGYSWERISAQLGHFIRMREALAGQSKPKFSVVIPSYERPEKLTDLMGALRDQAERDFEVVIVDQSAQSWQGAEGDWGFPLFYHHSPVKGAVRARNTGAMLAQGDIIAFVDDDCLPSQGWLLNARKYFTDDGVVGVEGLIRSDRQDDPEWRPVTNVGFEGIGFMTANLLVRSSVFQHLGGFDLQFDKPHFREDTDFGWRMLDLGRVPYASDVEVFHPAQPRALERESLATRNRFFVKDAILWQKHPERYRELFLAEGHFLHTPGFGAVIRDGFAAIGVSAEHIPAWIRERLDD
ncbi:glycosyltransferase involved in cell wall biosynthesis/GT2 family glycosyltransferase [Novosphingobium hassiacum]|uniref:Glycosyltransferase involved in cell wall biosynthesis/GT2 family glycosyltransferase n=1 Tax=Novosphingobium hassiacum TaxID=173676 RepID=A0A7W6EUP7_9SPHN|nr:glycosyltransferase [Novosphingobium hassiacum]MBB3859412.1 glycosyltransferase involved in cell wall biosynthesis/GT2 family glycosyltransferase [Novosphingobium hassiacum]